MTNCLLIAALLAPLRGKTIEVLLPNQRITGILGDMVGTANSLSLCIDSERPLVTIINRDHHFVKAILIENGKLVIVLMDGTNITER